MKNRKIKRYLSILLSTLFLTANFSNIQTAHAASLSLKSEVNSSGNVKLTVSGGTSGSSYRFYVYKDGKWQTISAYNYETNTQKVNVLNVYPTKDGAGKDYDSTASKPNTSIKVSDTEKIRLQKYMDTYGEGKINVIPVSIEEFNNAASNYLWEKNGTWQTKDGTPIDVVYFGSYDAYGKYNDISDTANKDPKGYSAVNIIKMFIKDQGSVLFGHDCVYPGATNFWQYFKDEVGLTKGVSAGLSTTNVTNIATDANGHNYPSIQTYLCPITITNEGMKNTMLQKPNKLTNKTLTTLYTHTTEAVANKNNVFVQFTPPSSNKWYVLGKTTPTLSASDIEKGNYTYNYYIAGNGSGHIFQTQAGHEKGNLSPIECQLLANMFFYLKQTTTETFDYYYDCEDTAKPDAPTIETSLSGSTYTFDCSAEDNGTSYKFKVDNISSSGTTSATTNCSYATGIDHYIYSVDSSPSTTITSGTKTTTGSFSKTLSTVANKYVHVAAVDKAGNIGPTETTYIETKPDLTITNLTIKDSSNYTTSYLDGKETATITMTIKNQGLTSSDACTLSLSGPFSKQYIDVPSISKGSTKTITATVTINNIDTTSNVSAFVDCYNAISESNESNNTYTKTVYVTEKNPDLTITNMTTYKNNITTTRFKPGDKAEIRITVKNQGNEYADSSTLKLTGPFGTYYKDISGLSTGSSTTIIIPDAEAQETTGTFTLKAYADYYDEISELNENNNTYSKNIEISYPYPILNATSISGYSYISGNNYWFSMKDKVQIQQSYASSDTETDLTEQSIYLSNENGNAFNINFKEDINDTTSVADENIFSIEDKSITGDINSNWQGYVSLTPKSEGKFLYSTGSYLEYNNNKTYYNNQETNSTNKYVNIDGTAPKITVSQSPTAWTNGNVTITSSSTDINGSGVKNISINNNTSNSSSKSYTVSTNGTYKVSSSDNVGNVGEKEIQITNIDKLSPKIVSTKYKIVDETGNNSTIRISVAAKDAEETEDNGCSGLKTVTVTINGIKYTTTYNEETKKYEKDIVISKGSQITVKTDVTDNAGNTVSKTETCNDGKITTSATVENYNYFDSSKNIYWVNSETNPLIKTAFNMSANYYEKFIANENIVVKKLKDNTYNNIAEIFNNHADNGVIINGNKCSSVTECDNEDVVKNALVNGDPLIARNIDFNLNLNEDTLYKVQSYYNDSVQETSNQYSNTTYPFIIGYDSTNPTTKYTQSPTAWTNGNVTISYSYNDNGSGVQSFKINDVAQTTNGSLSKAYTTNGIYKYEVTDKVGNTTIDNIEITNIDKLDPFVSSIDCARNKEGTTRVYIGAFDALATSEYGCSGVKEVYVNSTGTYQKAEYDEDLKTYYYDVTTPTNNADKTISIKVIDNANNSKIESKVIKQPQLTTNATVENYNYFDSSKNIYWVNADTNPLVNVQFNLSENTYNEHIANINLAIMQNSINKAEAYNNYHNDDVEINKDKCVATFNEDIASVKEDIIDQDNTAISGDSKSQRDFRLSLDFKDDGLYTIKPYFNMLKMEDEYQNANTTNGEYNFKLGYDSTKPSTQYNYSETKWTNKDVTVTYQYEDSGSGMKSVKVDSTNQTLSGNKTITKTYSTNGVHLYEASDNVDNTTTDYVEISNIDKLEPIIDHNIKTTQTSSTKMKVDVTVEDQRETTENGCSGIKSVIITKNNTEYKAEYNQSSKQYEVEIPIEDTEQNTIIITATDNAGNISSDDIAFSVDLSITNLSQVPVEYNYNYNNIITRGYRFSAAVGNDGYLYTWGNGTGSTPTKRTIIKPITIAASYNNILAIGDDENLYLLNSTGTTKTKLQLATGVRPKEIAAGYNFYLVIGSDSKLYYLNSIGTATKVTLPSSKNPETITCGRYRGDVIDTEGNLYQLTSATAITKITLASGITCTSVADDGSHTLAIGSDGELYSWGSNSNGELGNGTTSSSSTPKKITLATNVKPTYIATSKSSCAHDYSMAVGDDGNLYAWGNNSNGQLGTGDTTNRSTPTKININGIKPAFIIGGINECSQAGNIMVDEDGKVYGWGYNGYGQLGTGDTTNKTIPTEIKITGDLFTQWKQISVGSYHTVAIDYDGNIYTWGRNNYGQLGDGTTINKSVPTLITLPNGNKAKSVSCGLYHTVVIDSEGNIYTWGYNNYGQLGNGTTINKTVPTLITLPNGNKAKSVSCGYFHTAIIDTEENLFTCGQNNYGQLGDGTTTNKVIPTLIILPNGNKIQKINCGGYNSMTIDTEGNLFVWGYNYYGTLGDGTTIDKITPTQITLPSQAKVKEVGCGYYNSIAVDSEGNIYTWGYNNYGQLGNGTTINKAVPTLITLPNGNKAQTVSCKYEHIAIIDSDRNIYTWGLNNYGQLGDETTAKKTTPTQISIKEKMSFKSQPVVTKIEVDSSMEKSVKTNCEYTISGTIANLGTQRSPKSKLTIYYEDGSEVGSMEIDEINSNGTTPFTIKLIAPPKEGRYTLTAKIDSDDAIDESNENNNTMQIILNVSNSPADLQVTKMEITETTNTIPLAQINEGKTYTLRGTVSNCGDSTSPACKTRITDNKGNEIGIIETPEIKARTDYNFTINFKTNSYGTTYKIIAEADYLDEVIEKIEGNNTGEVSVEVIGYPDLQVNNLKVATTNNKYVLNTNYELTGTIVNKGHGSAAASVARITDNTGKTLGTINVPELQNNEEYNFKLEFTTPPTKGDYTIKVYTDYNNKVEETDETNNEGSITINVKSRLEILELSCIKRTLGIEKVDTTKVSGPVTNPLEILVNAENTLQLDCSGAKMAELSFYVGNEKVNNIKFKNTNAKKFVTYNDTLYKYDASVIKDGDNGEDNKVAMITNNSEEDESLNVTFVLPKEVKEDSIISIKIVLYDDEGNTINTELGNNFFVVKGSLQKKWNINNIR